MKKRKLEPRTILLVAIPLCLLAVALFFLIRAMNSIGSPADGAADPSQQLSEDGQQGHSSSTGDDVSSSQSAQAQTIGQLVLYYDDGVLERVDGDNGLVSLLPDDAEQVPRLDLQPLGGSMQDLSDAEIQRLAVGLLQAYYVDAPATDAIAVSADQTLQHAFFLEVPATEDAPALTAQVRFLEASDGLWYLLLLHASEETAPADLLAAYETVAVK